MGKGYKAHMRVLRQRAHKVKQEILGPLYLRIDALEEREAQVNSAIPILAEFQTTWVNASFFRRVWNSVRYVFMGTKAFKGKVVDGG